MADDLHRALEDGRHFVREILDQVNAERCEKDGTPKLFPNGVRDIYAKVSIAGSFIEVEISGADGPHRGGGSVEVTGSDGMIVSLNRPMVVNRKTRMIRLPSRLSTIARHLSYSQAPFRNCPWTTTLRLTKRKTARERRRPT